MDLKQVKELISAMEKAGLKKIRIKEEKGFEVEIEKMDAVREVPVHHAPHKEIHLAHPAHPPVKHHEEAPSAKADVKGTFITSPMVGTYYASPSPDDPAFIKVGDEVTEDSIVCIVEAMKVMNEVKAGKKGRVVEILLSNADPVEFGTKMFRIE